MKAAKSSTPRLWRRPSTACNTIEEEEGDQEKATFPPTGRTSLRSSRRKTGMRAGRSNTPRRSRAEDGECAGGRPRDPGVRLQEPCTRDRSGLRPGSRNWTTTHAAAHDGARLEDVLDRTNTASDVWADTAYRSAKRTKQCSRGAGWCRASIARSRQAGRCLSACVSPTRRNPKVRSAVEHVFAHPERQSTNRASSCARSA